MDGNGEPTHAGGNVTTWNYDSQRGWLTSKRDAASKGADYTYTPAGRLKTRTWARTGTNTTSGILTTYSYSHGLLSSVVYSNDPASTPTVSYSYDGYGRPVTVTQGSNTHTYAYDAATLVLDKETIDYNGFTRILDRSQDGLLRPTGFSVAAPSQAAEHSVSYTYDTASRLSTVANGTDTFTYSYLPDSYGVVEHVTRTGGHTVTNAYEASRNVLLSKTNHTGTPADPTPVISKFAYTTNNLGQRTSLTTSGSAFTTAPVYSWSYNAAGELVEADDTSAANNDRAYQFDAIGNREKTADGLLADLPNDPNYIADAVNQYTKANGVSLPVDAYDDDGNLTVAPLPVDQNTNVRYHWDAENRLVKITSLDETTTIAEYSYDYLGRRISKSVPQNGTPQSPIPISYFLYDGWNIITEYSGTTLAKTYTWGMDLSGSMQGAGGVGGLLSVSHGASSYYPTYDGNGNVSEYLDSTGTVQAHYEYDAFGNTVVGTGTKVNDFAHRFSTKPHDAETGLYYYGYRYYDPVTGRWPSRDPIEEKGGLNLYSFIGNDGLNNWDYLGRDKNADAEKEISCICTVNTNCECKCKKEGEELQEGACGAYNALGEATEPTKQEALKRANIELLIDASEGCFAKKCPLKEGGACQPTYGPKDVNCRCFDETGNPV
ncbi:RHS repeat-associated core domain-containing protein [Verrucomicrobiaceae bacterium 5K15]|uniref:RHS repeat-associated core domain-containing protein n=1 Tax=Oceaniferula flava TaxID=2800421 RepID=A0AAE2SH52_9BACT|nr:RHS repeat-associated core domain-containing protein [Oceaniferula flavus]MBK1856465.1 RHS repeat-associated core domain-containing protein [Oceaniferula flavus]MBM1137772.1 RHS repeat-associated core domain-containing protein [Oceaniferula flavus]